MLLPEGTRLVHIGPPKTGTTSLQAAFHEGRAAVAAQGVHYAGPRRAPMNATRAVAGLVDPATGKVPSIKLWQEIVDEVRRSNATRSLISSEYLSRAEPDSIRTIVADLDPASVHIVITLRSLLRILPSQWQQGVRNGATASYEDWLDAVFDKPESRAATSFWTRHRHDALVARWAAAAGKDRVTVVALDDADHSMVLRVFEALLGLRDATLGVDRDPSNRSLNIAEVELLRAFNRRYRELGLSTELYHSAVTRGASFHMKARASGPDEPRIVTPDRYLGRARLIAQEMVDAMAASGVRVYGDAGHLTAGSPGDLRSNDPSPPGDVPLDVAVTAAMGMLVGSGVTGLDPAMRPGVVPTPRPTGDDLDITTPRLLAVLARRGATTAGSGLHRVGRAIGQRVGRS